MSLSIQGKKEMEAMIQKHRERSQQTVQIILENIKGMPEINRKLTIMLQKVIKRGKDIEILKEIVQNHEERLRKVEG